ncbi:hypothetical protein CYLTODRAFT_421437 [Cylindrobasidium torrendii FP15055 ss-10]|uniref:RING-type domain-containing protein n=1 Tax=Cylindrobasidium torrendii FP15055 ss-10 TaxID=1314674 RepID=A0A0D7BEL9_9AGAR|nr:hypothetical protein CYLTODRAFT_421437 [Cylindrobasidium torrendii FP15055 ss-10]
MSEDSDVEEITPSTNRLITSLRDENTRLNLDNAFFSQKNQQLRQQLLAHIRNQHKVHKVDRLIDLLKCPSCRLPNYDAFQINKCAHIICIQCLALNLEQQESKHWRMCGGDIAGNPVEYYCPKCDEPILRAPIPQKALAGVVDVVFGRQTGEERRRRWLVALDTFDFIQM